MTVPRVCHSKFISSLIITLSTLPGVVVFEDPDDICRSFGRIVHPDRVVHSLAIFQNLISQTWEGNIFCFNLCQIKCYIKKHFEGMDHSVVAGFPDEVCCDECLL